MLIVRRNAILTADQIANHFKAVTVYVVNNSY